MPIKTPTRTGLTGTEAAINISQIKNLTENIQQQFPSGIPIAGPVLAKGKINVDELAYENQFQKDTQTLVNYFNSKDDNFITGLFTGNAVNPDYKEFWRDGIFRASSIIDRSNALQDAPEEVKEAYKRARPIYEESGAGRFYDIMADAVPDLLLDPINLIGLLSVPLSSGGTAAAAGLARAGVSQVALNTIKNTAVKSAPTVSGAFWAGLDSFYDQRALIASDLQEEFSKGDFGLAVAAGGGFGWALGKGGQKLIDNYKGSETANIVNGNQENLRQSLNNIQPYDYIPINTSIINETDQIIDQLVFNFGTADNIIDRSKPIVDQIDLNFGTADDIANAVNSLDNSGTIELAAQRISRSVGGGQSTTDELVDEIRASINSGTAQAAENTGTEVVDKTRNNLLWNVGRVFNKLNAAGLAGRAVDYIEPYTNFSNTAKRLKGLFRYDANLSIFGGAKAPVKTLGQDFFESFNEISGTYITRFKEAFEPILVNAFGDSRLKINNEIIKALRTGEIPAGANNVFKNVVSETRSIFNDIGTRLGLEDLPDNYVPRAWQRSAILNNQGLFAEKLMSVGYSNKQALSIIDGMLRKNADTVLDNGGGGNTIFVRPRVLSKITNDDVFKDFLENDIHSIVNEYSIGSARSIAKKEVLGVINEADFKSKWINTIRRELRESGFGDEEISKAEVDITRLYRSITGENLDRLGGKTQALADTYTFFTRAATLPLATLSSITEVFLNIGKAGAGRTIKSLAKAMDVGFKKIAYDSRKLLGSSGYDLTTPEIVKEMQRFGLVMDQAISDIGSRLSGEAIVNNTLRRANNTFFKANMLDGWTKFVQMTSYITGKNLIADNIQDIARAQNLKPTSRILRKQRELAELGIDINKALEWFNAGALRDDPFIQDIQRGAARYTNGIILQPEAASGLKPMLHSNPQTALLFQLMGYPAAFTNTILKEGARKLIENPVQNGAKILPMAIIMTEVANFNNWVRTPEEKKREYENLSFGDQRARAIARWGGNGLYMDMFTRFQTSKEYIGPLAIPAAITGPVTTDVIRLSRTQDPVSFLGQKVPGYGAFNTIFGEEWREDYDRAAREIGKKLNESVREGFAKGGIVFGVPNTKEEPDERIDKMTGRPYNEQAGEAFTDEEDRLVGFAVGGFVGKLASTLGKAVTKNINPRSIDNATLKIDDLLKQSLDKFPSPKEAEDYIDSATRAFVMGPDEPPAAGVAGDIEQLDIDTGNYTPAFESYMQLKDRIEPSVSKNIDSELTKILDANYLRNIDYTTSFDEKFAEYADEVGFSDMEFRVPFKVFNKNNAQELLEEIDDPELYNEVLDDLMNAIEANDINDINDIARYVYEVQGKKLPESNPVDVLYSNLSELDPEVTEMFEYVAKDMPEKAEYTASKLNITRTGDIELTPAQREEAFNSFIANSVEKEPVYRGTSAMNDYEFDLSFALARETGAHTGTPEQAHAILIRDMHKMGFKDYTGEDLTYIPSDRTIEDGNGNIIDRAFFPRVDNTPIPNMMLQKGYIQVKNPLVVDFDLGQWDIFTIAGPENIKLMKDALKKNIKDSGEDKSLNQFNKLLDEAKKAAVKYGETIYNDVGDDPSLEGTIVKTYFSKKLREVLQKYYDIDSIKYLNAFEGAEEGSKYSYILFNPQQFKVVGATRFDTNDPRPTFNAGGKIIARGLWGRYTTDQTRK